MMKRFSKIIAAAIALASLLTLCSCSLQISEDGKEWCAFEVIEAPTYTKKGVLHRTAKDGTQSENVSLKAAKKLAYSIDEDGGYYVSGIGDCRDEIIYISPRTPDGNEVTGILDGAFAECENLKHVVVGEGISLIADTAFIACHDLLSVTLPNSVVSFGAYAFYDCDSLVDIKFGKELISIPDCAFMNCDKLSAISIPNSVKSIGSCAFTNCCSIEAFDLPADLEKLGSGAFSGCTEIKTLVLPDKITQIPSSLFSGCTALCEFTIGDNIKAIYHNAFRGCTALDSLYIPANVTEMEVDYQEGPFTSCRNLTLLCEAPEAPEGWDDGFDTCFYTMSDEGYVPFKLVCKFGEKR